MKYINYDAEIECAMWYNIIIVKVKGNRYELHRGEIQKEICWRSYNFQKSPRLA